MDEAEEEGEGEGVGAVEADAAGGGWEALTAGVEQAARRRMMPVRVRRIGGA
jgi:hypothetical protein